MSGGKITLITFDLDNTLWDVETVIRGAERALQGWLADHAPRVREEHDTDAMMAIRQKLVADEPGLAHNLSELRRRSIETALNRSGYSDAEAMSWTAFELFIHHRHQVDYYPQALQTLANLAERYALVALSNGNADIERLGLSHLFKESFSAAKVGRSKPAPDMFHAALEWAGAEPAAAVHVGDHPRDDIAAADAVGMHTVWVPHHSHDHDRHGAPERVSATASSLADVPLAIEGIERGLE